MSRRVTAVAAAVTVVALVSATGCSASPKDQEAAGRAESLWASRVEYVGDGSRVSALVGEVGPAPAGSYTISLQTAKPPYGLTIDLTRSEKPFELTDFSESATLLLGLVTNLDTVTVTWGRDTYSMTTAAATKDLGYDVKELGRDQDRLTEYVDAYGD